MSIHLKKVKQNYTINVFLQDDTVIHTRPCGTNSIARSHNTDCASAGLLMHDTLNLQIQSILWGNYPGFA